jgi:pyruvate formate lyase activating enzyme
MNTPEANTNPKGIVLNIQHFCTHDGPGMRTTVFLKGCTFRCKWCSNPESINPTPELAYNSSRCIGKDQCGYCLKECQESALFTLESDAKVRVNWDLCTNCGACVAVCPPNALYLFGQEMSVSGGECLLQADFAAALLSGARQRGIHTAIETAGNVPWSFMERVLQHVDLMLHDHKLTDLGRHKTWIGVDNSRSLENYKKAYETFPGTKFIARTPLIPGVNDDEEHIRSVLAFIKPYPNVIDYELLPYMRFGESKYGFLGRVYEMQDFNPPTEESMRQLRAIIDEAFGRTGTPKAT